MIGAPPLFKPSVQLRPILEAVVIEGIFYKFYGGSGEVIMMVPLPGAEKLVVPITFVAEI